MAKEPWQRVLRICLFGVALCFSQALDKRNCPVPCQCFNQGNRTVDCTGRGLRTVPQISSSATRIYLDNNSIRDIPDNAFKSLKNLTYLYLQNNTLASINTSAFCNLPLRYIDLSSNNITLFHVHPPCVLESLEHLDLSGNGLSEMPDNLNIVAPNLQVLNLTLNSLRSNRSMADLHNLRILDLRGNPLVDILTNDYSMLKHSPLDTLILSECELVSIEKDAFQYFDNLTTLSLSENLLSIKNLENVFQIMGNSSKLQKLELSEMLLPRVGMTMLGMFSELEDLNLAHSAVETVDVELFDAWPKLHTLQLQKNKLVALRNLTDLHELRNLNLEGNRLQVVALNGLRHLESVNLASNLIIHIPKGWLSSTDTLKVLNLRQNRIRTIHPDAFENVIMRTLDLSHNSLTTVSGFGNVNVKNLRLAHNYLRTIPTDAFQHLANVLQELDLSSNSLIDFSPEDSGDFISLQKLNLTNNNLGPSLTGEKLKTVFSQLSHLQVLVLSNNHVTRLPSSHAQYLHHVTTLYLNGNEIESVQHLSLDKLKNLAKLVLSDNRLQTVEPEAFEALEYLEVVDLGDNPYLCSCKLQPYKEWLQTPKVRVIGLEDTSRYQCCQPDDLKGQPIVQVNLTCPDNARLDSSLLIVIAIVCVLVLGSILLAVLCYDYLRQRYKKLRYRWQIRYREISGVEIAPDPKI